MKVSPLMLYLFLKFFDEFKLRLKFRIIIFKMFALSVVSPAFSFFPFFGEDTFTLGKNRNQLEIDLAYFRYYDRSYHQDLIFQLSRGMSDQIDAGFAVPYSKFYDGTTTEGLNDVSLFVKHIFYTDSKIRSGYRFQINLDTGRENIGYGGTTVNLNLMLDLIFKYIVCNLNLIYVKADQIEELRDSYGFSGGIFVFSDRMDYGMEVVILRPENQTDVINTHFTLGFAYHINERMDLSFGFNKTVTRDPSFVDYGLLWGFVLFF